MELIADILMIAGSLAMALYCIVLSRRLSRFTDLEKGVGGAIAVLSAQVDDMTKTLTQAQKTATLSARKLEELTQRAEGASRRLEILIASTHDLPEPAEVKVGEKTGSSIPTQDAQPQPSDTSTLPEKPTEEAVFLSKRQRIEAAQ